uniref:NAD(P)(+)--arginine ADP-ribosyltransferase n=1 Tax=Alexandrium monilatum TaxID=311494 RepID=A0A7S4Q9Y1_9DINO
MAGWRGEVAAEARSRRPAEEDEAPRRTSQGVLGLHTWPSRNFKRLVEEREIEHGETEEVLRSFEDEQVSQYADEIESLELDDPDRQKKLCTVYSLACNVYSDVNKALREDDAEAIEKYAPFIKELRDVFLTDHENQVITPFEGTVYRGITFDDPEKALEGYQRDHEFAWPAFSSTSLDSGVADGFGSGLVFEIRCYPPAGTYDDDRPEFAPASISEWSAFGDAEKEVLFPPNVTFRVVNVKHATEENGMSSSVVQCETVEFASVWSMVKGGDVEGVKRWCQDNPDRVNTEDCQHHLLDEADSDGEEDSDEESDGPQVRSKEVKLGNDDTVFAVLKARGAKRGAGGRRATPHCDCSIS